MKDVDLPEVFAGIADRVSWVQKRSENEYTSSCPNCGGTIHEDGSYPDRFVMWVVSRSGTPFGMCLRGHCGFKWNPLKQDAHWTDEERAEFQRKRIEIEKQREEKIIRLSETIREQGRYISYNQALKKYPEWVGMLNEERGLNEEWIDFLKIGFIDDYPVNGNLSSYHSPAYAIPVWTLGDRIENVKVRIIHPKDKNDRYRNLYRSGAQHLYVPHHTKDKIGNKALVMEGEFKAIAAEMYGGLSDDLTVTGWQSKSPEKRVWEKYSECEVVYLALDWDAYVPDNNGNVAINQVAKRIGVDRVRYIIPPKDCKFDDIMLKGFSLFNAVNMAIKPKNWKYWSQQ